MNVFQHEHKTSNEENRIYFVWYVFTLYLSRPWWVTTKLPPEREQYKSAMMRVVLVCRNYSSVLHENDDFMY